jgi:type II secretory pathway component GspD/PulD (secretin)
MSASLTRLLQRWRRAQHVGQPPPRTRQQRSSPTRLSWPRWLGFGLLALAPVLCSAEGLEIIPLHHRLVSEVLPLLRPLLAPEGTLTGTNNQLIIKTTPVNLAEIERALASIDVPFTRLRIAVAQSRVDHSNVGSASAGVRYRTTGAASELALEARTATSAGRDDQQVVQSVLTLDGQPAYINVGQIIAVPVVLGLGNGLAPGQWVGIGNNVQTASTGFYVTPHLRQDSVLLSLDTRLERFAPDGSNAAASNATTVNLNAQLGEWVVVGGSTQRGGQNASDYQLLIRVERVP